MNKKQLSFNVNGFKSKDSTFFLELKLNAFQVKQLHNLKFAKNESLLEVFRSERKTIILLPIARDRVVFDLDLPLNAVNIKLVLTPLADGGKWGVIYQLDPHFSEIKDKAAFQKAAHEMHQQMYQQVYNYLNSQFSYRLQQVQIQLEQQKFNFLQQLDSVKQGHSREMRSLDSEKEDLQVEVLRLTKQCQSLEAEKEARVLATIEVSRLEEELEKKKKLYSQDLRSLAETLTLLKTTHSAFQSEIKEFTAFEVMKDEIETLLSQIQRTVKKRIEQVKKRELLKRKKLQIEILELKKLILGMVEGFCRIQQKIRKDEDTFMFPKPEDHIKDFIIKISQIYKIVAEKILRFSKEQEESVEIQEVMTLFKEDKLLELQKQYDVLVAAVKSYFGREDLDHKDLDQLILVLKTGSVSSSDSQVPSIYASNYSSSSEEVSGFGSDVSSVCSVDSRRELPVTALVIEKLLELAESYDGEDKRVLIEKICSGTLIDLVLHKFLTKLAGGPQIKEGLISEIKAMLK